MVRGIPAGLRVLGILIAIVVLIAGPSTTAQPRLPEPRAAASDPIKLIKDINTTQLEMSFPDSLVVMGDALYFVQESPGYGREVWKTDGTSAGSTIVKDIWPGETDSNVTNLTNLNGTLYFFAIDSLGNTSYYDLWKSDGTEAGTVKVKEMPANFEGIWPEQLTLAGDQIFFVAENETAGMELWRSDGTSEGTFMVKDINPQGHAAPQELTAVGNTLYFIANDGTNGRRLWKSDGTSGGTVMITQPDFPDPAELTALDDKLYFRAAAELWVTDGTVSGTQKAVPTTPVNNPESLTVVGTTIYFSGYGVSDGDTELWKYDSTTSLMSLVKDINPADGSYPVALTAVGSTLYFTADDGTNGRELWKSRGTAATTVLVKNINPGGDSNPDNITLVGSTLYFTADDGVNGVEVWKTDGTANGTSIVKNINPTGNGNSKGLTAFKNQLYFTGYETNMTEALWKSDGTAAGTVTIPMLRSANGSSLPWFARTYGSLAFMPMFDGIHGMEPWKTDGTITNTLMIGDINPAGNSDPAVVAQLGNSLYFTANDGAVGRELWRMDADGSNPQLFKDIRPGGNSSSPRLFTVMQDKLYFSATGSSVSGRELWSSDGTITSTVMVKNINTTDYQGSLPQWMEVITPNLYFSANDGTNGRELWKSDGTITGTLLLKDINPTGSSYVRSTVSLSNTLYFLATDGTHGMELWKSNGTEAGTVMVKDINPDGNARTESSLVVVGSTIFFAADDGVNGVELWKSDGTTNGTVMVKNIHPTGSSELQILEYTDTMIYFRADDGVHGYELWASDGTSAGTYLVKDIYPGSNSSYVWNMTYVPSINRTFFTATDGVHGQELWQTDGTTTGTILVQDLLPGAESSSATALRVLGDRLLISAFTLEIGFELYALDTRDIDTTAPDTFITSQPDDPSNSSDASFSFSGSDTVTAAAGLTFACSLDGAAFTACTSPQNYTGLTAGDHTFQVKAIDAGGNIDATPASFTWAIDTTAPDTSITSQPDDPSNSSDASFSFSGSDNLTNAASLTFACSLDGAAFTTCTSPKAYTGLANGSHTFQVKATDAAGNTDATPASYTWKIEYQIFLPVITAPSAQT